MSTSPGSWVQQSREYLNEVQAEFKKVTWPSQQETIAGTISTVAVVAIVAVALGIVDWTLSWVITGILP